MKKYKVIKRIGKRYNPGATVEEDVFKRFSVEMQKSHFEEIVDVPIKKEKVTLPKVEVVKEDEVVMITKPDKDDDKPKVSTRWIKE